jgi:hypothetical protein
MRQTARRWLPDLFAGIPIAGGNFTLRGLQHVRGIVTPPAPATPNGGLAAPPATELQVLITNNP